jgi:hypothetical protein
VAGGFHEQGIDQTARLAHFRTGSLSADPLGGAEVHSSRHRTLAKPQEDPCHRLSPRKTQTGSLASTSLRTIKIPPAHSTRSERRISPSMARSTIRCDGLAPASQPRKKTAGIWVTEVSLSPFARAKLSNLAAVT